MNIAIIAHSLHPISQPYQGGLEMITYILCRSLFNKGHDVTLYAHHESEVCCTLVPFDVITEPIGLPPEWNYLKNTFGTTDLHDHIAYQNVILDILGKNFDIVHNHSLHYLPILMESVIAVPLITTIHTPPFSYLEMGASRVDQDSNQIFTMVSSSLADTWKSLIPKASIIYNGIDITAWTFNVSPLGDYLFWYGRICPEKGTHLAIEAAILSDHILVLAGPISNEEYFDEFVSPYLDLDEVHYAGHLHQLEINRLLGNAKLFLFTSTWSEPYGLTIAEALCCGTPVLAFDSGAAREIITRECGILVELGNMDGLLAGIDMAKLIDRRACRKRAEEFCSHETMVEQYESLYGDCTVSTILNNKAAS